MALVFTLLCSFSNGLYRPPIFQVDLYRYYCGVRSNNDWNSVVPTLCLCCRFRKSVKLERFWKRPCCSGYGTPAYSGESLPVFIGTCQRHCKNGAVHSGDPLIIRIGFTTMLVDSLLYQLVWPKNSFWSLKLPALWTTPNDDWHNSNKEWCTCCMREKSILKSLLLARVGRTRLQNAGTAFVQDQGYPDTPKPLMSLWVLTTELHYRRLPLQTNVPCTVVWYVQLWPWPESFTLLIWIRPARGRASWFHIMRNIDTSIRSSQLYQFSGDNLKKRRQSVSRGASRQIGVRYSSVVDSLDNLQVVIFIGHCHLILASLSHLGWA